jgi:sugar/nucleoside kinase (ribokinase family)
MSSHYDVLAVGHAIVDVQARSTDAALLAQNLTKGAMTLIDHFRAHSLKAAMIDPEMASGGSAGNTIAGLASLGGTCAYIGKVAHDEMGQVFSQDLGRQGVTFNTEFLHDDPTPTGICLIHVTSDAQRTMATCLGAAALVGPSDIKSDQIKAAGIVYLEGYLFDTPSGREAFSKAAMMARAAGRKVAITLSDTFVVERWHDDLLAFIENHIDMVFANEGELMALFHAHSLEAAISALRQKVDYGFVTRSEHGSIGFMPHQLCEVKAHPVSTVVDTTGAGDQYAAGVLYGLSQSLGLETSLKLGSMAASEVIGHFGPRPHVSLKALAREQGLLS